MSQKPPRRRLRPIQLRAQHGAQIPNGNRHRRGSRALRLARHVGRWPRQHDGGRRVDAGGGEDGADVGDAGSAVWGREEDDVADYSEGGTAEDERRAFVGAFGEDGDDDCEDGGDGVGGDGEELGVGGAVAEVFDDGWEEEGEGVEGEGHGVEAETVEPAFVVFEGGADVDPYFVGC